MRNKLNGYVYISREENRLRIKSEEQVDIEKQSESETLGCYYPN
jgi:hypothetical protein